MQPVYAFISSCGPRRPLRRLAPLLCALALALGCAEDEAQPGEPGGPCRVGAEPCIEGYGCSGGLCAVLDADAGVAGYSAQINASVDRIPADGESVVDIDFVISTTPVDGERRAYDPATDGEIFLSVTPVEAGRIEPARPMLVEGLGLATFVPCHRGVDARCPDSAIIRIAREAAPLEPFAESEPLRLLDPEVSAPDMGTDGGM